MLFNITDKVHNANRASQSQEPGKYSAVFFIFLWRWSYVLIIVKNVNQMFVVRYIYVMRSLTIVIIQCISGTIKESSSWILNLLVGYKCTDYNIVFLLYELTGWFWI